MYYCFSALWISINPLDLKCPLVLIFAGVSFSIATNQTAFRKMQDYIATINFVAIALFFHINCVAIIDYLLAFERQNCLLGPIFHHYGVVEFNGRSMLYLHYIVC